MPATVAICAKVSPKASRVMVKAADAEPVMTPMVPAATDSETKRPPGTASSRRVR